MIMFFPPFFKKSVVYPIYLFKKVLSSHAIHDAQLPLEDILAKKKFEAEIRRQLYEQEQFNSRNEFPRRLSAYSDLSTLKKHLPSTHEELFQYGLDIQTLFLEIDVHLKENRSDDNIIAGEQLYHRLKLVYDYLAIKNDQDQDLYPIYDKLNDIYFYVYNEPLECDVPSVFVTVPSSRETTPDSMFFSPNNWQIGQEGNVKFDTDDLNIWGNTFETYVKNLNDKNRFVPINSHSSPSNSPLLMCPKAISPVRHENQESSELNLAVLMSLQCPYELIQISDDGDCLIHVFSFILLNIGHNSVDDRDVILSFLDLFDSCNASYFNKVTNTRSGFLDIAFTTFSAQIRKKLHAFIAEKLSDLTRFDAQDILFQVKDNYDKVSKTDSDAAVKAFYLRVVLDSGYWLGHESIRLICEMFQVAGIHFNRSIDENCLTIIGQNNDILIDPDAHFGIINTSGKHFDCLVKLTTAKY